MVECGTNLDPGFPADAAFKYHVRVQPLHLFQVRGDGCPLGVMKRWRAALTDGCLTVVDRRARSACIQLHSLPSMLPLAQMRSAGRSRCAQPSLHYFA